MQRTKSIKPFSQASAILCGDVHLREDTPVSRTDDFWDAQWRKMDFISDLQKKHDCPVLCSGDLFNYWKPSPNLLSFASEHLPDKFYTVYGQHDLPQHSRDLDYKSGLYNLWKNNKLTILNGCSYGEKPEHESILISIGFPNLRKILVWHVMNYQGKAPWPGCTDPKAATLLRKYPQYDLIVTGDNHKPFVEEHEGHLLVNVGSMMRITADQIDYKPAVWLYYAETNTVTKVYLPIEEGVLSREHLDVAEQRETRISSFIESLDGDWKATMSFEQNVEMYIKMNSIRKSVVEIVNKAIY